MRITGIDTVPGSGGIGQTSQGTMLAAQADMTFYFEERCYVGVLVKEKATGNLAANRRPKPYIVPAHLLRRIQVEPVEEERAASDVKK